MNETIVAISTALGVGAISIIRVSGKNAISVVNRIFKGTDLFHVSSHTIHYGHIVDHGIIIDEVLVSVMLAPKTFTTEDVVEINAHGGIATTNRILELLLEGDARLAEPGEFTKWAFLNGRIDLIEAEGIMELISSKTEKARSLAINQVDGKVSQMIRDLRTRFLNILSNIEVNIDYPEYEDIEVYTLEMLSQELFSLEQEILKIILESEQGKIVKEGIKTAIIGRPNVGKSSLLNRLLTEEKAIVTDIAGTTRDIVEGSLLIEGIPLHLIDTAGIRESNDLVEQLGVKQSLKLIEQADLILFVLNQNETFMEDDQQLLEMLRDKHCILVLNKKDLENHLVLPPINCSKVSISTLTEDGIDDLKTEIKKMFHLGEIETKDPTYLSSARSIAIMKRIQNSIMEVRNGVLEKRPIDMIEIDIKEIWSLLGEIIGETYEEELIDHLFQQFCLGK